jgi:hypothetical protein
MIVTSHWWQYWGRFTVGLTTWMRLQEGESNSNSFNMALVQVLVSWQSGSPGHQDEAQQYFGPSSTAAAHRRLGRPGSLGFPANHQPSIIATHFRMARGTWRHSRNSSRRVVTKRDQWNGDLFPAIFFYLVGKCKLNDDLMRIYQWFILW